MPDLSKRTWMKVPIYRTAVWVGIEGDSVVALIPQRLRADDFLSRLSRIATDPIEGPFERPEGIEGKAEGHD